MKFASLKLLLLVPSTAFSILVCNAQIQGPFIHGKWTYGTVRRIDESEPINAKTMPYVVGDKPSYHFLPNQRFERCFNTCVNGDWEFENKTNVLSLFTDAGQVIMLTITRADKDTMAFNVRNKVIHTLVRVPDAPAFKDSVQNTRSKAKKFKVRDLENRWELVNISEEKNVPEEFRPATRIFKGWVYTFSKDGKVTSLHYEKRIGNWKLDRHRSLVVMYGQEGEWWHIVSLSKTEMVLKKPGLPNLFKFKGRAPEARKKPEKTVELITPVK